VRIHSDFSLNGMTLICDSGALGSDIWFEVECIYRIT